MAWKISSVVLAAATVVGFGGWALDAPEVVVEEKVVEKIVELPVENTTKIEMLEAELGDALLKVSELEPVAVEGNYKLGLEASALEELEDEREEVADFLYDEFGYVIDEEDIKFRNFEEWSFDYDYEDLQDEDVEDVDAIVKVEFEVKGEDELSDDDFKESVEAKFEFENGKMKLKKLKAL